MELKLLLRIMSDYMILSINRTIVELKCTCLTVHKLLENAINRTIVELKLLNLYKDEVELPSINRTIVELKCIFRWGV